MLQQKFACILLYIYYIHGRLDFLSQIFFPVHKNISQDVLNCHFLYIVSSIQTNYNATEITGSHYTIINQFDDFSAKRGY